uniref:Uncharacterized protein n=1 Tax=Vespula pensylvanica TaxID=30213 RepID=A0A834K0R0_VESPE|nr:hypothetical protein H0235_016252 [Vespula pensylvanica]
MLPALLGMYGWPPGYNKANSAELSRQLVPQHVLPLVLHFPYTRPPTLPKRTPSSQPLHPPLPFTVSPIHRYSSSEQRCRARKVLSACLGRLGSSSWVSCRAQAEPGTAQAYLTGNGQGHSTTC